MADSVTGFDEVMKNLNREINGIKNRSFSGLMEASLKIEARSNERVPVDSGNLVGSSYTRKAQDGSISVEIGYTAHYAANIHEMVEQKLKGQPRANFGKTKEGVAFGGGTGKGTYWAPNGEPKFLEKTLRDNEKNIVDIIRHHASVDK